METISSRHSPDEVFHLRDTWTNFWWRLENLQWHRNVYLDNTVKALGIGKIFWGVYFRFWAFCERMRKKALG
jgi:hypothetical protein